MPFTFAYRSQYDNLTGRYIKRFEEDTILSWFKKHWRTDGDSKSLLGQDVYGFKWLFEKITEHEIPSPETFDELGTILKEHIYAERRVNIAPHLVEVFTDDDELELQYFFVGDDFANQHPERTGFLLHAGSLPTEVTGLKSDPCTYLFIHSPEQTCDSQTWDRVICPGVRLSDDPKSTINAYSELEHIESEEFRANLVGWKEKNMTWPQILEALTAVSDCEGQDDVSEMVISDHICQLHHHASSWDICSRTKHLFDQVIVFDDVWANDYPDLAKSIDFYARDRSLLQAGN